MTTIVVAVAYAIYRKLRFNDHRWICRETGIDIANGVGLFPLFLLAITVFHGQTLQTLTDSAKIIFSVAGIVALLAILDEGDRPASA